VVLTLHSRYAINALMAAGIMFLNLVQLKITLNDLTALEFEAGKSFLATGLWIWLM
jgi:hypothetical protein